MPSPQVAGPLSVPVPWSSKIGDIPMHTPLTPTLASLTPQHHIRSASRTLGASRKNTAGSSALRQLSRLQESPAGPPNTPSDTVTISPEERPQEAVVHSVSSPVVDDSKLVAAFAETAQSE